MVEDHVAVITLGGKGTLPWGTNVEEHRLNPATVEGLNQALDQILDIPTVYALLVTHEGKFFSNGLDLKYIEAHPGKPTEDLQVAVERLLARILTYPLPSVAAINGHFTAAGAMLGLAFDKRVMREDKGFFFVPAIDIGLIYSPGQTALMRSKTPQCMHMDMIVFGKRYTAKDLHLLGVVQYTSPTEKVKQVGLQLASELTEKGKNQVYRRTMHGIKKNLHAEAYALLTSEKIEGMGFEYVKGVDRAPTPLKSKL